MEVERELKHVKEERETINEEASHLEMRESKKGGKGKGIGKRVISVVGKHFVYFEPDEENKKDEKESGERVINVGGEPTVFFEQEKEKDEKEKESRKEVLNIEGESTVIFNSEKENKKDEKEKESRKEVLNMEGEPTVIFNSEKEDLENKGEQEKGSGEKVLNMEGEPTVFLEPEENKKSVNEKVNDEIVINLGEEPTTVYFEPEEDEDLTDDSDFSYIGDDHGDYFTEDNPHNAKVDNEAIYADNLENVAAEEVDQKLRNEIQEYGSNSQPSAGSKFVNEITRIGDEIEESNKLEPEKSTKFKAEEYDLERIIEEQETHDLYCPNCHSCITRTVILRKRKRTYREIQNDIPLEDGQHVPDVTSAPTEPVEHEDKTAFRCLSCFSFFIPTDGGFNIFKMFGKKNGNNIQNTEKLPEKNVNSVSSLFSSSSTNNKGSKAGTVEQGNKQSVLSTTVQQVPSGKITYYSPGLEGNKAQMDKNSIPVKTISEDPFDGASYSSSVGNQTEGTTRNYPAITISDGISTNKGNIDGSTITIEYIPRGNDATKPASNIQSASLTESIQSNENIQGSETSVATETVVDLGVQGIESSRSSYDLDSLKSVLYGGLIESITSLSVVSSAAGAGSSTSHIGTLGLANLVGGLFLIYHDLSELHESHDEEVANQGHPEKSQYFKKLGKREHWKRHAFITILSYIIFGSLPPIVYAFTFRSSNNQNLKIIAMASSSLFFISLLALGKAHARPKKGYIKSLFYYLAIAIPASGLSFVAGVLIDKLFVKLGLFESSASPSPSPPSLFEPLSYSSRYGEWQAF